MTRRVAQDIPVGLDFRAAGTSLTAAKDRLNGVAEVDAGVVREMTPAPLLIDMIVRNRCDVCKGWICQEPRAPKSRKVESPHPADDRTNENRDKSAKHPTSSASGPTRHYNTLQRGITNTRRVTGLRAVGLRCTNQYGRGLSLLSIHISGRPRSKLSPAAQGQEAHSMD